MSDATGVGGKQLSRTERRRLATHEQLLSATRRLLIERGRGGYTVSDLAAEADVGVGTVYNHFDDWRDDPIREICDRSIAVTRHMIADALAESPNAAVAAASMIRELDQMSRDGRSRMRLVNALYQAELWPKAETLELAEEFVRAGIEDGSFRGDIDPTVTAAAIVGLDSEITSCIMADIKIDIDDVIGVLYRILGVSEIDLRD